MTDPIEHLANNGMRSHFEHSFVRHTAYYLIGRLATGLIGLAALVAFTHVLSPADYGRYAVILAITALIANVGFQWLRQCLVRFGTGAGERPQPLLGTLGAMYLAILLTLVVVCVALALLVRNHSLRMGLPVLELVAIWCLTACQAWFELAADSARARFQPWRYSTATFARALLSVVLGVVAALLTHQVLMVVFAMAAAYLFASVVTVPPSFAGLLRLGLATWREARRLAAYGLPLALALGMTFILDSADRLMLAGMRGYTEAGVYSSAYNLALFSIGTVLSALGLGSLPLVVGAFRDSAKDAASVLLGHNFLLGIAIGLPAVVGIVILAPALDRLLLGNYVAGRSDIVTVIIAVAIGLAAIRSYCVDLVFMLHQRTWVQTIVIAVSALVNILLNLVLIPRWGAIGAASASLMAFLLAFLGSWFLSRYYVKMRVGLRDVVKIVLGCGVMVGVLLAISPDTGRWPSVVL
ncbi:MAG TPA: lipopolysaccharide biosynthesis protein, partial [Candidatus Saccharimonadales bacterium]|nr:lipopolysaccharide biosynthesis protein [Candidatus Saccharimonadales bacterium]